MERRSSQSAAASMEAGDAELMAHLDREEAHLRALQEFAAGLHCRPLTEAEQSDWTAAVQQLQGEAAALVEAREALRRKRAPEQAGPLRLSQLPLPPRARATLDRRRREVRLQAGRTVGALRGMMTSLTSWNALMQSTLDSLLGAPPQERTYSAGGSRAAPARGVILDVRS